MPDIKVIQPSELSTQDFIFEGGSWRLVRPYVDGDADNALTTGLQGGVILQKSELKRYRIIPDNATSQLKLYEYYGNYFDLSTATLVDSIDLANVSVEVDDVAISGSVLNFTDVQSGQQLTFDTALPIYQVAHQNSNSIAIQGDGKYSELVVDLIVEPDTRNLIKVSTYGVMVNSEDILALFNAEIDRTLNLTHESDVGQLQVTVGGTTKQVSTTRLVNSSGVVLGYILT